jgi:hypothetical protein
MTRILIMSAALVVRSAEPASNHEARHAGAVAAKHHEGWLGSGSGVNKGGTAHDTSPEMTKGPVRALCEVGVNAGCAIAQGRRSSLWSAG